MDARSQKSALSGRIEFRRQQVAALDGCVATMKTLRQLRESEQRHLESDAADMMNRFLRRVELPAGMVLALLLANIILRRLLLPIFFKRENLLIMRRATSYFVFLIVTLVLAVAFLEDLKAIATLLGIIGAAIVIALQDLCSAFAGWFVIVAGRKVRVGDRVEIDGHRGDVVDIEILRTTLLELNAGLGVDEETGRVQTIPNSFIFKSQVFNFTRMHPYIWGKIDITVTYETPFRQAHELLWRVLNEETRERFEAARAVVTRAESRFGLPESHYEPKMYTVVADSGVLFSMLYVAHYKKVSATRTEKIGTRILEEFEKDPRMQLAYPTTRQFQTEQPLPPRRQNEKAANTKEQIVLVVGSAFGLGLAPIAPGSFAALLGLAIHALAFFFAPAPLHYPILVSAFVVFTAIHFWLNEAAAKYWDDTDSGNFVMDEVAGYLVTALIILPLHACLATTQQNLTLMVGGFLLFRVLDIIKFPPARTEFDRQMHNAWGVILDDLVSGVYAGGAIWAAHALGAF